MYKKVFDSHNEDSVSYGTAEDKIVGSLASALGSAFASIFAIAPVVEYANHTKFDEFMGIVDKSYLDKKLTHDEGMKILGSYNELSKTDKQSGIGYFLGVANKKGFIHTHKSTGVESIHATDEESYLSQEMVKPTGMYDFWYKTKDAYANHNMNREEYNAIWKAHDKITDPLARKGALSIYNDIIWRNAYDHDRYGSFERSLLKKITNAAAKGS
ncbi:MAG: hypothetical protein HZB68_01180 [Candidatus Aenigmarchaeota archaeon]|nr:hypothetical protein [Candidatus Aenigmarchaeota archaeon]